MAGMVEQRARAIRELVEAQESDTAVEVLESLRATLPAVTDDVARAVLERRTEAVMKALNPPALATLRARNSEKALGR